MSFAFFLAIAAITDVSACSATGDAPEMVAPGEISLDDRHEFGATVDAQCTQMYVGVEHGDWVSVEAYEREADVWVYKGRVDGAPGAGANDPYLTPDGTRLYYILQRAGQTDIVYRDRAPNGSLSEPVVLPAPVNTPYQEFYISFSGDGDLVFSSDRDATQPGDYNLYRAVTGPEGYAEVIAYPEGVNTTGYEADPFLDPDGDYLLFASNRAGGKGFGDLYVSFAATDGGWTPPRAIGAVNTAGHELCPFVTPDGETLYYTSDQDIYRVSISVVEALRPDAAP